MEKKGQGVFGLSFGVIFSIIILIFIFLAAFLAINHFRGLSDCTRAGLFYEHLQDEISSARADSGLYRGTFGSGETLPNAVEKVCFGDLSATLSVSMDDVEIRNELKDHSAVFLNDNVFLYPPGKVCGDELSSFELDYVKIEGFFCKDVEDGEVSVSLSKSQREGFVSLSK